MDGISREQTDSSNAADGMSQTDNAIVPDVKVRRRPGRPVTLGAKRTIQVRLDSKHDDKLEQFRASRKVTRSAALRELIDLGFDKALAAEG